MNRRLFGVSALATGLTGCGFLTPKHSVHFKMDVYATVQDRAYRGTSVFEIRWTNTGLLGRTIGEMPRWVGHRSGDALVLDLGSEGLLFGLWEALPGAHSAFIANEADYLPLLPNQDETARYESGEMFEDFNKSTRVLTLPPMHYPAFVRFRDIRDLKSAQAVNSDNVSAIYGAGSSLGPVTLQVTHAPINRGVAKRLPFWNEVGRVPINLNTPTFQNPLYANLNKMNFMIDGEIR